MGNRTNIATAIGIEHVIDLGDGSTVITAAGPGAGTAAITAAGPGAGVDMGREWAIRGGESM